MTLLIAFVGLIVLLGTITLVRLSERRGFGDDRDGFGNCRDEAPFELINDDFYLADICGECRRAAKDHGGGAGPWAAKEHGKDVEYWRRATRPGYTMPWAAKDHREGNA